MAKRAWKKVAKGIYVVGDEKSVYFRMMIGGKRETKKVEISGPVAISSNGKPTAALLKKYEEWRLKLSNRAYYDEEERKRGGAIPSFEKLIELYEKYAPMECAKSGKPAVRAQETAVKYFRYLVAKCGFQMSEKITKLTTGAIDNAIATWLTEGKSKDTAKSYAMSCKSLTARWALPKYREEGWQVEEFGMPVMKNMKAERYKAPKEETQQAMDALYESLWHENMTAGDYQLWFAATMIFKFEMRPDNVRFITMTNDQYPYGCFKEHNGITYLCYTPHKTANSSGRFVNWPVHPDYWERIKECFEKLGTEADKPLVPSPRYTVEKFNDLADRIPEIHERGRKCYEFRKLDMHRTFHKFGAEKVSAKSGDDIKTITYYYADISWVDMSEIDIAELK